MKVVVVGSANRELTQVKPNSWVDGWDYEGEKVSIELRESGFDEHNQLDFFRFETGSISQTGSTSQVLTFRRGELHRGFGGGGVNMGVGVQKLMPKAEVVLFAPFGYDQHGREIQQFVESWGIRTIPLRRKMAALALCVRGQKRRFLFGYRPEYRVDTEEVLDQVDGCDLLFGGGLRSNDTPLVRALRDRYQPHFFLGPSDQLLGLIEDEEFAAAISGAKALQITERELQRSTGISETNEALRYLEQKLSPEHTLVTRDRNGGIFSSRDSGFVEYKPYLDPRTRVDATGAGDSLLAAFGSELVRTSDPAHSLKFARITASLVCKEIGGATMPARQKIEQHLGSRPS